MANAFITKEVNKVINESGLEYPKSHAMAAAWIIANFKGVNIKIYDVSKSSSLCDYNIIASAQNTTQAKAMLDEISYNLKQNGGNIISLEGVEDGNWILVDMGDIIIHLFQEIGRDIFDLDTLWGEYPTLEIPSSYYFSHPENQNGPNDSSTGSYF